VRWLGAALRRALGTWPTGAVAILSLALGIAAQTVVFAFVDAVVLRPLPVRDADSLVAVSWVRADGGRWPLSLPHLNAVADLPGFERVAGWSMRGTMMGRDDEASLAMTAVVSDDYFAALGITPAHGRFFAPGTAEEAGLAGATVVLGNGLWLRRFGGDPAIVGQPIRLNGQEVTVVGVAPGEFQGLERHLSPDVWVSLTTWGQIVPTARESFDDPQRDWLDVIARLAPGESLVGMAARLEALGTRVRSSDAAERRVTLGLVPLAETRSEGLVLVAVFLLVMAALILLVACVNIANLLVARSDARRHEIAIRAAIGASPAQLARELLHGAAVLGATAALVATAMTLVLIRLLPAMLPDLGLPLGFAFRYDLRVAGVTVVTAVIAVLACGLLPAFRGWRGDLTLALRQSDTGSCVRFRLGDLLVVGQMAVCLALLVVAALLVQSLRNAAVAELGFVRQPMVLVQTAPGIAGLPTTAAERLRDEVQERVATLPGVRGVSWTRRLPLSPTGGGARREVAVPGYIPDDGRPNLSVPFTAVGAGYFSLMGSAVTYGREFESSDSAAAPRVAVINETMATRVWGGRGAVGQNFRLGGVDGQEVEVVGVVQDGKYVSLAEEPAPYLFLPLAQNPSGEVTMVVAIDAGAGMVASTVRQAFRDVAPQLPVVSLRSLDEHLDYSLYAQRLSAGLVRWLRST